MKGFSLAVAVLLVAAAAWEACAAPGGGGGGNGNGGGDGHDNGNKKLVPLDDSDTGLAEVFSSLGALGERKRRDVNDGDALTLLSGLVDIRVKRESEDGPGKSGGKGSGKDTVKDKMDKVKDNIPNHGKIAVEKAKTIANEHKDKAANKSS